MHVNDFADYTETTYPKSPIKRALQVGDYAIAENVKGFAQSEIRVRIIRFCPDGRSVNVRTASLLDSGTNLVLDWDQLFPCD